MSRSEFRYNKKRKHYAYLFKDVGEYRKNVLLSTKSFYLKHNKKKKNVKLYLHPNGSKKQVFVIPRIYLDHFSSFDVLIVGWVFDKNDKRKIKRIKKDKPIK